MKSTYGSKAFVRVNWHELAGGKSVCEHVSLQDACINFARAVKPVNIGFITRPFADRTVFGLEKAALAERPLSELADTSLHWIMCRCWTLMLTLICKGRKD